MTVIVYIWYLGAVVFLFQQVHFLLKYPDVSLTLPEVMVKFKKKEEISRRRVVTGLFIAIGTMCLLQAGVLYFIRGDMSHRALLTYYAVCLIFDYIIIIISIFMNIHSMKRR